MMINVEIFEDRDSGMGVSTRELGRVEVFFLPSYSFSSFFFFPSWQLFYVGRVALKVTKAGRGVDGFDMSMLMRNVP